MKSVFRILVLAALAMSIAGCTSLKRYSIESYQGLQTAIDDPDQQSSP